MFANDACGEVGGGVWWVELRADVLNAEADHAEPDWAHRWVLLVQAF